MRGTVKFYNTSQGYGFIRPDDGTRDVFVHVTALQASRIDMLNPDDVVSFDLVPSPRRSGEFVAANVQVLVANL